MPSRMHIGRLVDIVRTQDPAEIRMLAADPGLDRRHTAGGPILNRLLAGYLRKVLSTGSAALPAVLPRGDSERLRAQTGLRARLDADAAVLFDGASIAGLARAVSGSGDTLALALATQEAAGRCFAADYQATHESFRAAQFLDRAARTPNPLALVFWKFTGKLGRQQRLLADKVGGSAAGVHATGIAVHTLLRSFDAMRLLRENRQKASRYSVDNAVAQCLVAPNTILREVTEPRAASIRDVPPGALVMLELEAARQRDPGADIIFLAGTWAECPASRWVPALLRAVWERANSFEETNPE